MAHYKRKGQRGRVKKNAGPYGSANQAQRSYGNSRMRSPWSWHGSKRARRHADGKTTKNRPDFDEVNDLEPDMENHDV